MGLVVTERLRSYRIGARLLTRAEEWATGKGVQRVRVRTNVMPSHAHDFCRRAGYRLSKPSHLFSNVVAAPGPVNGA